MSVKIGKFGFVNNYLPYYQFEQNGLKVIEALPKQLAKMLEKGEIDFAPVPSFYYIKNRAKLKSYEFCVASKNSVLSVIIVSNGKKLDGDNGSIAVTNQTVTSLNLLKIILREKGLKNRVVVLNECNVSELLKCSTYALVIGDEAIKARMTHRVVMDLGEEWHELTGYPMVFGISVSRKDEDMSEVNSKVMESVEWGNSNVDLVVSEAEKKFGLPVVFLARYFRALTFRMGAQEKSGLELFGEKCHEYRLL